MDNADKRLKARFAAVCDYFSTTAAISGAGGKLTYTIFLTPPKMIPKLAKVITTSMLPGRENSKPPRFPNRASLTKRLFDAPLANAKRR